MKIILKFKYINYLQVCFDIIKDDYICFVFCEFFYWYSIYILKKMNLDNKIIIK